MSDNSRTEQLRALVAGSQRMLQLAEAGDWEAVARLQDLRQQLSESFFAEPVGSQGAAEVKAAIRQILANDTRITTLGREARDSCQSELKSINRRRHAARQYSANKA